MLPSEEVKLQSSAKRKQKKNSSIKCYQASFTSLLSPGIAMTFECSEEEKLQASLLVNKHLSIHVTMTWLTRKVITG